MKKIFTLFLSTLCTLCICAQTFKGTLNINVMGLNTDPKNANVEVIDNGDGTAKVYLPDFTFDMFGESMAVGNITVPVVNIAEAGGVKTLLSEGEDNINLTPGSDPNIEYIASALPVLGGKIEGTIENNEIKLSISMVVTEMPVVATFTSSKEYEGTLNINIATMDTDPKDSKVELTDLGSGVYVVYLPDFTFDMFGESMAVGNIMVPVVTGTPQADGSIALLSEGTEEEPNIILTPGTDPSVEYVASALPKLPGKIEGVLNGNQLDLTINMNVTELDVVAKFSGKGEETSINAATAGTTVVPVAYYTVSGAQISTPAKGVNIIRMSDKTVKKVLVK